MSARMVAMLAEGDPILSLCEEGREYENAIRRPSSINRLLWLKQLENPVFLGRTLAYHPKQRRKGERHAREKKEQRQEKAAAERLDSLAYRLRAGPKCISVADDSTLQIAIHKQGWVETGSVTGSQSAVTEIFASLYLEHTPTLDDPVPSYELIESQVVRLPQGDVNVVMAFTRPLSDQKIKNAVLVFHVHLRKPQHHGQSSSPHGSRSPITTLSPSNPFYLAEGGQAVVRKDIRSHEKFDSLGYAVLAPHVQEKFKKRHTHHHPRGGHSKFYWQSMRLWAGSKRERVTGESILMMYELSQEPRELPQGFFCFSLAWKSEPVTVTTAHKAMVQDIAKYRDQILIEEENTEAWYNQKTTQKRTKKYSRELHQTIHDARKFSAMEQRREARNRSSSTKEPPESATLMEEIEFINRYEKNASTRSRVITYRFNYGKDRLRIERRTDFLCPFGCGESALFGTLKSLLLHFQTTHRRFRVAVEEDGTGNPQVHVHSAHAGKQRFAINERATGEQIRPYLMRDVRLDTACIYRGGKGFTFIGPKRLVRGHALADLLNIFLPPFQRRHSQGPKPNKRKQREALDVETGPASLASTKEMVAPRKMPQQKKSKLATSTRYSFNGEDFAKLKRRQLLHTLNYESVSIEDVQNENSDDEIDESWIIRGRQRVFKDFTDVEECDKKLFEMWDRFLIFHPVYSEEQFSNVLIDFVNTHGEDLVGAIGGGTSLVLHLFHTFSTVQAVHPKTLASCLEYVHKLQQEKKPRVSKRK